MQVSCGHLPIGGFVYWHRLYLQRSGTAHRPFPTYFNGRTEMNNVGCPNNCQLSIVNFPAASCLSLWERWPSAARTERVNVEDTIGRDYLTNAPRPSQSRLRRASSPRGRAKVALATSPHYVILAAQKAPFRVLFVEIIPLFPVPVRPGPLRRKRGGRRRCLWLFWPCPFPYRWRSAPGPGWFFPPPS